MSKLFTAVLLLTSLANTHFSFASGPESIACTEKVNGFIAVASAISGKQFSLAELSNAKKPAEYLYGKNLIYGYKSEQRFETEGNVNIVRLRTEPVQGFLHLNYFSEEQGMSVSLDLSSCEVIGSSKRLSKPVKYIKFKKNCDLDREMVELYNLTEADVSLAKSQICL